MTPVDRNGVRARPLGGPRRCVAAGAARTAGGNVSAPFRWQRVNSDAARAAGLVPGACARPPFPMRIAPLLAAVAAAAALVAPVALAQSTFTVVAPTLSVDGRHVGTVGDASGAGGVLVVAVPGEGTYRISDRPFGTARRAGAFHGTGLAFAADGRSVRLTSREPILERDAPAYVQFEPSTRGERGMARLSLAGGPPVALHADHPRGPRGGTAPMERGETAALRAEIDRLTAERSALLGERARRSGGADSRVFGERDALLAERDRLLAERAQLVAERGRAVAERADLAQRLVEARRQFDEARSGTDARRFSGDADALRAQIVARDQSLALLRDERDDRTARLASLQASLTAALASRDAAYAARDAAFRERDALRADRDRLASERDEAFRQRDALLAEREARFRPDGSVAGWQARPEAPRARPDDDRDALRAERDAMRLQLEALQAERDRLAADRRDGDRRPAPPAVRPPLPPRPASPAAPLRDGAFVYLPGFDFSRLRNADVIQRRLDEAEYPRGAAAGRLDGEVLVLFQTDATGRVIRTAVPTPLGGGLDALAEGIVRDMRFLPPVVDGLPTGLRSQVTVRFER